MQAFYEEMPPADIQQFALSGELSYSFDAFTAGDEWTIYALTIPDLLVYVFTDIFFYALAPPTGLGAAPEPVNTYGVSGSICFVLRFTDRAPMLFDSRPAPAYPIGGINPYTSPISGWSYLDEPFGAQRTSGFALYARGHEQVQFSGLPPNLTQIPRFPISRWGVKLNGFTVPESIFDKLWLKFVA